MRRYAVPEGLVYSAMIMMMLLFLLVERYGFSAIPRGDKGFPVPGKLFVQGRK